MKTNIVIPVKNPSSAKQRLSEILTAERRKELALALIDNVLSAVLPAAGYGVLVVTDSDEIARRVRSRGAEVLMEPESKGETAAVEAATRWSVEHGFERQLVIPGDMPCVTPQDIQTLLSFNLPVPGAVFCPATGDDGTNAIMTAPPNAVAYRFGVRSFPDYLERARQTNVSFQVERLPNLVLDLDTPEDLKEYMSKPRDSAVYRLLSAWSLP